jgi:hypothetical protein
MSSELTKEGKAKVKKGKTLHPSDFISNSFQLASGGPKFKLKPNAVLVEKKKKKKNKRKMKK